MEAGDKTIMDIEAFTPHSEESGPTLTDSSLLTDSQPTQSQGQLSRDPLEEADTVRQQISTIGHDNLYQTGTGQPKATCSEIGSGEQSPDPSCSAPVNVRLFEDYSSGDSRDESNTEINGTASGQYFHQDINGFQSQNGNYNNADSATTRNFAHASHQSSVDDYNSTHTNRSLGNGNGSTSHLDRSQINIYQRNYPSDVYDTPMVFSPVVDNRQLQYLQNPFNYSYPTLYINGIQNGQMVNLPQAVRVPRWVNVQPHINGLQRGNIRPNVNGLRGNVQLRNVRQPLNTLQPLNGRQPMYRRQPLSVRQPSNVGQSQNRFPRGITPTRPLYTPTVFNVDAPEFTPIHAANILPQQQQESSLLQQTTTGLNAETSNQKNLDESITAECHTGSPVESKQSPSSESNESKDNATQDLSMLKFTPHKTDQALNDNEERKSLERKQDLLKLHRILPRGGIVKDVHRYTVSCPNYYKTSGASNRIKDNSRKFKITDYISTEDSLCTKQSTSADSLNSDMDDTSAVSSSLQQIQYTLNIPTESMVNQLNEWGTFFQARPSLIRKLNQVFKKQALFIIATGDYTEYLKEDYRKMEHIIELFNIPDSTTAYDLSRIYRQEDCYIEKCDQHHALLISNSKEQVQKALSVKHDIVLSRSMTEASPISTITACMMDLKMINNLINEQDHGDSSDKQKRSAEPSEGSSTDSSNIIYADLTTETDSEQLEDVQKLTISEDITLTEKTCLASSSANWSSDMLMFPIDDKNEENKDNINDDANNWADDLMKMPTFNAKMEMVFRKPVTVIASGSESYYKKDQNKMFTNMEHVIELFNIPSAYSIKDLLNIYTEEPRYIKSCDSSHALLITGSAEQANRALLINHDTIKSRCMVKASPLAVITACESNLAPAVVSIDKTETEEQPISDLICLETTVDQTEEHESQSTENDEGGQETANSSVQDIQPQLTPEEQEEIDNWVGEVCYDNWY